MRAARRSGRTKPLGIRQLRNLGTPPGPGGHFQRAFKGNSGVGVRFSPSRTARVDSVRLYLALQPPDLGHLGRPQRAQIGRPVSSSLSRHAAFPCQPAVLGCGTDPIRTANSTRGLVWDPRGACGGGWARALYLKFASVCSAHISAPPVTASPPTRNPADSDEAMTSYYDTAHSDTHAHPPFALCWASARRRGGRGCRWIWVYERPAEAQTRRGRP